MPIRTSCPADRSSASRWRGGGGTPRPRAPSPRRPGGGGGLVSRPRLLLLDEPLGALDAKLREEMQIDLINLQRDVGITFVFVTHAQVEALALSHRIAVMDQGRVAQVDEPARLYGYPKTRFVADFIGHINQLESQVVESTHGRASG